MVFQSLNALNPLTSANNRRNLMIRSNWKSDRPFYLFIPRIPIDLCHSRVSIFVQILIFKLVPFSSLLSFNSHQDVFIRTEIREESSVNIDGDANRKSN